MIPVKQNRVAPKPGNCAAAALASILEIPLSETFDGDPEICSWKTDNENTFWEVMRSWLLARNLMWAVVSHTVFGYAVAVGPSPRLKGADGNPEHHACVAFNGELVHDPHPDNTFFGGERPWHYWVLYSPRPELLIR